MWLLQCYPERQIITNNMIFNAIIISMLGYYCIKNFVSDCPGLFQNLINFFEKKNKENFRYVRLKIWRLNIHN